MPDKAIGLWEDPYGGMCNDPGTICVELELNGAVASTDCCETLPVNCECPSATRVFPVQIDLLPETAWKALELPPHAAPKIPFFVDHEPVTPEAIGHFDGTPLHFLMCRPEQGPLNLNAFTTREGLELQMRDCTLGQPPLLVREISGQATSGIVVYDSLRWGGAAYLLPTGHSMTLASTWWNDRISSLKGFGAGTVVTFFENADFSGSTLTLTTDLGWPDLSAFGWDGRASSLLVWPAPLSADNLPAKIDSGE